MGLGIFFTTSYRRKAVSFRFRCVFCHPYCGPRPAIGEGEKPYGGLRTKPAMTKKVFAPSPSYRVPRKTRFCVGDFQEGVAGSTRRGSCEYVVVTTTPPRTSPTKMLHIFAGPDTRSPLRPRRGLTIGVYVQIPAKYLDFLKK